jgi:hypothetical protein
MGNPSTFTACSTASLGKSAVSYPVCEASGSPDGMKIVDIGTYAISNCLHDVLCRRFGHWSRERGRDSSRRRNALFGNHRLSSPIATGAMLIALRIACQSFYRRTTGWRAGDPPVRFTGEEPKPIGPPKLLFSIVFLPAPEARRNAGALSCLSGGGRGINHLAVLFRRSTRHMPGAFFSPGSWQSAPCIWSQETVWPPTLQPPPRSLHFLR